MEQKIRFEVPPELCWGAQAIGPKLAANSVTVWQLSLEKIVAAPTFRPTPADKLQKMASGLGYVLNDILGDDALTNDDLHDFWQNYHRLTLFDDPTLIERDL